MEKKKKRNKERKKKKDRKKKKRRKKKKKKKKSKNIRTIIDKWKKKKETDVINDFHIKFTISHYLILISLQDIILPDLRTCACFAVTTVPRVASAAVRANGIAALRVHVTDGRRSGAFIYI